MSMLLMDVNIGQEFWYYGTWYIKLREHEEKGQSINAEKTFKWPRTSGKKTYFHPTILVQIRG